MILVLNIFHFLLLGVSSFLIGFLVAYFSITLHDGSYAKGPFEWFIIFKKNSLIPRIKELFLIIIRLEIWELISKISIIFEWLILRVSWLGLKLSKVLIIKFKKYF